MKILEPSDGHLSNFEVLSHIQDMRRKHKVDSKVVSGNLATVMKELEDYLKDTPAASQTEEAIGGLVESLSQYEFEKVELLMILNSRPKSETELDVLIDEMESRLATETQVQDVLDQIRRHLGADEEPEEEEGNGEGDGENGDIEMGGGAGQDGVDVG